ncbi:bis(5'-nucleosyl)-tetraphosphatase (symmetrical) [Thiocapsa imhoffii]|uniref:Bis(5'-nucleosyl)-tetraphosphatase, symmetrical n=1 Tax=Thiocapsa imhoffii TaxID=382777 RepID=A0A9X0WJA3_9GAMM|nr:symmetrical bis(5'-nucleosyl)-tetraphosphatase [Thiocapsa imhoffii]MBK1645581.1 bis(5'-nucleosyl)-tetraphosphatase (symmetrical) [Thiocapsa imhoffii]
MSIFAVGDLQGCYRELLRLLDRIAFDPARDHLWCVGDLVNRGPESLAVLRFVHGLGEQAITVLGNHDLHLLALAQGNQRHARQSNLDEILRAPDRDELLHWLRHRPLLHHDAHLGFTMIHAGLPPQWSLTEARQYARELELVLRGPGYRDFLLQMYGNKPKRWTPALTGIERLRFITNALTRLRFCEPDGALALSEKGEPGSQAAGRRPWFRMPNRRTRDERIIFGHWSTIGYLAEHNVWGLDSGCLWGGALTAIRLDDPDAITPIQLACAGYREPGAHA